METAPQRRSFQTLDGLRGVGAFIIVMRHVPIFFGPFRVPESFLAVDLFYLVSGLVVAHAYGERLARGGFAWDFFKTRVIRLYPLYLIGLLVGVAMAADQMWRGPGSWTATKIAECFGLGLLMIPRFPGLPNNGTTLNGPIWTLLYELIANMAYAVMIRLLNAWVLGAILIVCGAGLIGAELCYHTLDVGYNLTDQWTALARVGFSFFAGVIAYRISAVPERRSHWIPWALLAALAFVLGVHLPAQFRAVYELAMVFAGMPLLVLLAVRFEPGRLVGRLFAFIGLMSYSVYLLHQPLGNLAGRELSRVMRIPHDLSGLVFGAAFLAFVVLLSWLLDRFYDAPVRQALRAVAFRKRPAVDAAPISGKAGG